jgi:CRISPR/Cas system-associated exonuclease Cas4 (RecB family)
VIAVVEDEFEELEAPFKDSAGVESVGPELKSESKESKRESEELGAVEERALAQRLRSLFFTYSERERPPNTVYVTDLTQCFRRSWLELRYRARPRPTPQMVLGRMLHDVLELVLSRDPSFATAKFEVECSHDLGNGWTLRGRADCVTDDGVFEFKFVRSPDYNRAKVVYAAQVSAYCFMLGKTVGYLVLVDRERLDVQVLRLEPDEDLWRNVVDRAKLLIDSLEGDVPTVDSPLFEWECKSCDFAPICRKMEGGVK